MILWLFNYIIVFVSSARATLTLTLVLTTGLITIFILVISVIGSVRVHVSSVGVRALYLTVWLTLYY